MSSISRKQFAKRQLDDLVRRLANSLTHLREPFWRLLRTVQSSSRLLATFNEHMPDPQVAERVVQSLVRIVQHCDRWIRRPEDWIAPDANTAVQFRSLVSHLFDHYPVPKFMSRVWLGDEDRQWEIDLYLHLAAGQSIRQFDYSFSFSITKKTAAFFMQAPDDLSPFEAIRWAQIRSLGGDSQLARQLLSRSLLGKPTEHEPFWESVIRFLVRNQPITLEENVAIIAFIHSQKFLPSHKVWGAGRWIDGTGGEPIQPDFIVQGRSLRSLRRHIANWHLELASKGPLPPLKHRRCWERTEISPMTVVLEDGTWTVEELLCFEELFVEGSIMQHCVATYANACRRNRSSIWSIKIRTGDQRKRVLTVEVIPNERIIWQAKGRRNSSPNQEAEKVLQLWANREQLRFRE